MMIITNVITVSYNYSTVALIAPLSTTVATPLKTSAHTHIWVILLLLRLMTGDSEDILQRRNCFIGPVNNIVCFFDNLSWTTKLSLYKANCSSIFGCELWLLDSCSIEKFCVALRKGCDASWTFPVLHIITFYHCYQIVCDRAQVCIISVQLCLECHYLVMIPQKWPT